MNYSHIRIILGAMKKRFKFLRIDYRKSIRLEENKFPLTNIFKNLLPIGKENTQDCLTRYELLNFKKIVLSVIFLSLAKRKPFYLLIGISFDARNFFPHSMDEKKPI